MQYLNPTLLRPLHMDFRPFRNAGFDRVEIIWNDSLAEFTDAGRRVQVDFSECLGRVY